MLFEESVSFAIFGSPKCISFFTDGCGGSRAFDFVYWKRSVAGFNIFICFTRSVI